MGHYAGKALEETLIDVPAQDVCANKIRTSQRQVIVPKPVYFFPFPLQCQQESAWFC